MRVRVEVDRRSCWSIHVWCHGGTTYWLTISRERIVYHHRRMVRSSHLHARVCTHSWLCTYWVHTAAMSHSLLNWPCSATTTEVCDACNASAAAEHADDTADRRRCRGAVSVHQASLLGRRVLISTETKRASCVR